MWEIKDPEKKKAVKNAINNPEELDYPPFWQLTVANELISGSMETLTRETGDNGGMVIDSTISTRIDLDLINAPCHLHLYIGGERIPVFAGRLGKPKVHTSSTDIIGQSGATYLQKTKLQKDLDFIGDPSRLIRKVVKGSQAYAHDHVVVKKLRGRLQRTNTSSGTAGQSGPAWTADQSVRDVLSSVQQEIKCVFRDTPKGHMGTFECFMDPMEHELKDPVWEYDAEHEEGFTHEPSDDEAPYDVVVQRHDQQDTSTASTSSTSTTSTGATSTTKIIPGFIVRVPVKYTEFAYLPLKHYTDWTVLSDGTSSKPTSYKEARKQATLSAAKFARQYQDFSITVPLNPLLEMYDVIKISENVYKTEGTYRYVWICLITKLKDDASTMTSEISGKCHLKNKSFTEAPPVRLSGRTQGVLQTPIPLQRVFGLDALGLWVDTDFTTNSTGVKWAGLDANGDMWVDVDLSEGRAGIDPDGSIWFDLPDNPQ